MWAMLAKTVGSQLLSKGLTDGFGGGDEAKYKELEMQKIKDAQANTQGLVDEQLGMSRQLMDPMSAINQQMGNQMSQRAGETGAQIGQSMEKQGAMHGVSAAQTMMQSRMGQNQAMGGVGAQWEKSLQNRFGQGMGLMGSMTQMQKGLDENIGNTYIANTSAYNQAQNDTRSNQQGTMGGGADIMSKMGKWTQGGGFMKNIGAMFGG